MTSLREWLAAPFIFTAAFLHEVAEFLDNVASLIEGTDV